MQSIGGPDDDIPTGRCRSFRESFVVSDENEGGRGISELANVTDLVFTYLFVRDTGSPVGPCLQLLVGSDLLPEPLFTWRRMSMEDDDLQIRQINLDFLAVRCVRCTHCMCDQFLHSKHSTIGFPSLLVAPHTHSTLSDSVGRGLPADELPVGIRSLPDRRGVAGRLGE